MSAERGFTLVELLVSLALATIVMLGIFTMVEVTTRGSLRVDRRVEANQRTRPVLTRILDELHSTCLGPNSPPVLAGSGNSSVSFLTYFGNAVSPTPTKREITLSGTTLTEKQYAVSSGTAPNWTFAASPFSTRQLLTNVGPATVGSPATNPPLFRYYSFQNGDLSTTPLPTPLSAANAALTAQVSVAFSVSPLTNPVGDAKASLSVSDSALLRLSPTNEDPGELNPPCA